MVLEIYGIGKATLWTIILKVLDSIFEVSSKHVLCSGSKEKFIELPPGSAKLRVEIKLIHIDLCLSSLINFLQFLEATGTIFCGLIGIHNQWQLSIKENDVGQKLGMFENWETLDHMIIKQVNPKTVI